MSVYEHAYFSVSKDNFLSAFNEKEFKKHPDHEKDPHYKNAYLQYYDCPACKEGHGIGAFVFSDKKEISVMSFNYGSIQFIVYKIASVFPRCKIVYTIENSLLFEGSGKEYIKGE